MRAEHVLCVVWYEFLVFILVLSAGTGLGVCVEDVTWFCLFYVGGTTGS